MSPQELEHQVSRIESRFNGKKYSAEEGAQILKRFGRWDVSEFASVVDAVVSGEKFFPTVDRLSELARKVSGGASDWEIQKARVEHAWRNRPPCRFCQNAGTVTCRRRLGDGTVSRFRNSITCFCDWGRLHFPKSPRIWSADLERDYVRIPYDRGKVEVEEPIEGEAERRAAQEARARTIRASSRDPRALARGAAQNMPAPPPALEDPS